MEDANSKKMAVKTSSRIKSTDITDDDWPVIKKISEFPTQRRIPRLLVDPTMAMDDVLSKAQTEIKRGHPCIIRPKKGKSVLKLLQVLRQTSSIREGKNLTRGRGWNHYTLTSRL